MKILIILITLFYAQAHNIGKSVYDNIILKDIKSANIKIDQLETLTRNDASKKELKNSFTTMMISWKRVQALYLAADLDKEYANTPNYIDSFHQSNKNIYTQLDHILISSTPLDVAFSKNSTKSINALEYLIFKTTTNKKRRKKKMTLYIIKSISKHLKKIELFYKTHKKEFVSDAQKINAIIVNALIESSYKLKEWRVGDVAGLSRQYKNSNKNAKAEYLTPYLSFKAIESILLTHQSMIGRQKYINFADIIIDVGAITELLKIRTTLKNALKYLHQIPNYNFNSPETKLLYKELTVLHNSYYISLIGILKVASKILDSDGD